LPLSPLIKFLVRLSRREVLLGGRVIGALGANGLRRCRRPSADALAPALTLPIVLRSGHQTVVTGTRVNEQSSDSHQLIGCASKD
jgi:hypothetical protein